MHAKAILSLSIAACLMLGCHSSSESKASDLKQDLNIVTAKDLAGTYTGVLEGVTVPSLDALGDTSKQVIVDIDLLHKVTATEQGDLKLMLESAIIPKTRAIIAGVGSVAVNLAFVEFEGLDSFPQDSEIRALQVKNIAFVKYNQEWVFVLQIARVGFAADKDLNGVYVYQYVSYPAATAQQMSENEAIQYVNTILKLASSLQRN